MVSFIKQIQTDFPKLKFVLGEDFIWLSDQSTVIYKSLNTLEDKMILLHEIAHYQLDHHAYHYDLDLLKKEAQAWDMVRTSLAPHYKVQIDETFIEDMIDSYRDWLHQRSLCPKCNLVGQQIGLTGYNCLICGLQWQVNQAKKNGLKRIIISSNKK